MWLGSYCMLLNIIYVSTFSEFPFDAKIGFRYGFPYFYNTAQHPLNL